MEWKISKVFIKHPSSVVNTFKSFTTFIPSFVHHLSFLLSLSSLESLPSPMLLWMGIWRPSRHSSTTGRSAASGISLAFFRCTTPAKGITRTWSRNSSADQKGSWYVLLVRQNSDQYHISVWKVELISFQICAGSQKGGEDKAKSNTYLTECKQRQNKWISYFGSLTRPSSYYRMNGDFLS